MALLKCCDSDRFSANRQIYLTMLYQHEALYKSPKMDITQHLIPTPDVVMIPRNLLCRTFDKASRLTVADCLVRQYRTRRLGYITYRFLFFCVILYAQRCPYLVEPISPIFLNFSIV